MWTNAVESLQLFGFDHRFGGVRLGESEGGLLKSGTGFKRLKAVQTCEHSTRNLTEGVRIDDFYLNRIFGLPNRQFGSFSGLRAHLLTSNPTRIKGVLIDLSQRSHEIYVTIDEQLWVLRFDKQSSGNCFTVRLASCPQIDAASPVSSPGNERYES